MSVQELQTQHAQAIAKAEGILSAAERQRRPMTANETLNFDGAMREAHSLKAKIDAAKPAPTRSAPSSLDPDARRAQLGLAPRSPRVEENTGEPIVPARFSRDYFKAFHGLFNGGPLSAALYEGSSPAGGYAVPVVVNDQVVPLAPADNAIRRLATVVSTKSDVKQPTVTTRALAGLKTETSSFTASVSSLGQFTLGANFIGVEVDTSIEIAQDVDLVNAFVYPDAVSAFEEVEAPLFISGSGTGQPQGLIGNCGAGVTDEPDSNGNLVSIQATLDILGTLKAKYHDNATWVMQRATSLIIRKAQVGTNLYEPVFRRENGVDLLHGYKVEYEGSMPTAARGNTPVLFGDFASGYIIGDRGGSALRMKVLDQSGFAQGLMTLLFYRRSDGRVRRSEAIQGLTISAS
jgi:HK97 family phage major capsid protein